MDKKPAHFLLQKLTKIEKTVTLNRETCKQLPHHQPVKLDPWYQWHFANGYVNQQGSIVVEFIGYQNFDQTNVSKKSPQVRFRRLVNYLH
ncbi:hypothetical protein [Coleofasciculus sp. G2-EDA-02]|uniref:hypothetical protein n=1 Tax=Coleofasciculus sp. G2-EDA-02 TaxID=3069529 RepID=UPI0032F2E386